MQLNIALTWCNSSIIFLITPWDTGLQTFSLFCISTPTVTTFTDLVYVFFFCIYFSLWGGGAEGRSAHPQTVASYCPNPTIMFKFLLLCFKLIMWYPLPSKHDMIMKTTNFHRDHVRRRNDEALSILHIAYP